MTRSQLSILGFSIVLATTACGARHGDARAENRAVLARVTASTYAAADRRLLAAAIARSDAEGRSLAGVPIGTIVANERRLESIVRSRAEFHPAVGVVPKSERSLEGPNERTPLISGAFDRVGASL